MKQHWAWTSQGSAARDFEENSRRMLVAVVIARGLQQDPSRGQSDIPWVDDMECCPRGIVCLCMHRLYSQEGDFNTSLFKMTVGSRNGDNRLLC